VSVREGTERPRRVLVVEDDSEIATILSEILEAEGYAPVAVSDAAGVNGQLDPRPDLVVLDLRLTRDGAENILKSLRARDMGDVPVLLLSAASDLAERARELGVTSYLAKPFELEDLLVKVRSLV
jgi:two-component system OmpR family response regulator